MSLSNLRIRVYTCASKSFLSALGVYAELIHFYFDKRRRGEFGDGLVIEWLSTWIRLGNLERWHLQ